MRGENVLGIANKLIEYGIGAGRELTHMQLQKLCYMAHGFTLALLSEPLTSNRIEAWDMGPVYPALYDALKAYGNQNITEFIHEKNWALLPHIKGGIVEANLNSVKAEILDTVWNEYKEYSAFELSALTHEEGTPWSKAYKAGIKGILIEDRSIKEYFVDLTSHAE